MTVSWVTLSKNISYWLAMSIFVVVIAMNTFLWSEGGMGRKTEFHSRHCRQVQTIIKLFQKRMDGPLDSCHDDLNGPVTH